MSTKWNPKARPYKVGKHRRIADYEAVRSRYNAGETCQEIADTLGCTRSRISQIVSDIARPGARLPVEKSKVESNIKEIKKELRRGVSAIQVARSMGLSVRQLRSVIPVKDTKRKKVYPHGDINRFRYNECRCDRCRKAYNAYHNAQYHKRQQKKNESEQ
jgi:uncharacterized protein (UPF0335 family)